MVGKPNVSTDLKAIIEYFKPDVLVGAVGVHQGASPRSCRARGDGGGAGG